MGRICTLDALENESTLGPDHGLAGALNTRERRLDSGTPEAYASDAQRDNASKRSMPSLTLDEGRQSLQAHLITQASAEIWTEWAARVSIPAPWD